MKQNKLIFLRLKIENKIKEVLVASLLLFVV